MLIVVMMGKWSDDSGLYIVLICVYMYNIYTVFLLLFITVLFTVLFYIVKLNIIFFCTISSTCYVRIKIIIIVHVGCPRSPVVQCVRHRGDIW